MNISFHEILTSGVSPIEREDAADVGRERRGRRP